MAVTAGASFGKPPTWVFPEEPEFHILETQAETMKKEYYNMSGSSAVYRYRVIFSGVSDTGYNGGTGIFDHFIGQTGGYSSFTFCSIPTYALSNPSWNSSVSGRWVPGSFKSTPQANSWDLEIGFERDTSLETGP